MNKTWSNEGARLVALVLCWMLFSAVAAGQNPDLEKCRRGDAAACERLGFSPDVAKQLAKYLKKGDPQIWQTQNQELLWAIGKTSAYGSDRQMALARLTNQAHLLDLLLLADSCGSAEEQALAKISDPVLLTRVVQSSPHETLRSSALEKLDDPRCLMELAIQWRENERGTNTWLIEKAIDKLNDPQAIARLATTAEPERVRELAVRKLADQAILLQVAAEDTSTWVRIAALERVTDQPFLARLALSDADPRVRKAAVGGVRDQSVLAAILAQETDGEIRQIAAMHVTDERLLADLVLAKKLGYSAVSGITSQVLLQEIALKSTQEYARSTAVKRIEGQAFLQAIVLSDPEEFVRCKALERITDVPFLMQVLKIGKPCSQVDPKVLDRMGDQAFWLDLSVTAADVSVRWAAIERLTDRRHLAELAQKDDEVRFAATRRLEHLELADELQSFETGIKSSGQEYQPPYSSFVAERVEHQPGVFRRSGQLGYVLKGSIELFTPHKYTLAVYKSTGSFIHGPSEPSIREAYLARVIVGGSKHTAIVVLTENAHYYFLVSVECYFPQSNRTERFYDGCQFPDTFPVRCEPVYLTENVFRFTSENAGEGVEEAYRSDGYVGRKKAHAVCDPEEFWTWKLDME